MRCPLCRNNSYYMIKLYSNIGKCSICMNDFTNPVAFIKCGHIYCLECINTEAIHRNEFKPHIISDESIINNNYTSSNSTTPSTSSNSTTPSTSSNSTTPSTSSNSTIPSTSSNSTIPSTSSNSIIPSTSSNSIIPSTLSNSTIPSTVNRSNRSTPTCLRDTCPYPSWNNLPNQCCSKTCRNKKCIMRWCIHDKLEHSSYCITHFIQMRQNQYI